MKKNLPVTLSFIACSILAIGQQKPFLQSQQCFGGTKGNPFPFTENNGSFVQPTTDSGYITFYNSHTEVCADDDCNYYYDYYNDYLIKKKADGSIQWENEYESTYDNILYDGQQTADGGYVAAGEAFNYDQNSDAFQKEDFLVVKFDDKGNSVWAKTYGGSKSDVARSVRQTSDGGYIITGKTSSHNGDVTGNNGITACWLVKLNSSGNIQWQKCYGASSDGEGINVRQTQDGGFIIIGATNYRGWIFKTDDLGNILWQKRELSIYSSIQQTNDGGYIVGGSIFHPGEDAVIEKFDNAGNKIWQKTYGGTGDDELNSILQTHDNGYIAAGYTNSQDGDVDFGRARGNFWVVRTDSTGELLWNQTYGGNDVESANSICNTSDNGYVIAGTTHSNDKYIYGQNENRWGAWTIKLSPENLDEALHLNPYHKASDCTAKNDISCTLTNPDISYTIRLYRFGVLFDSALNVKGRAGFHDLPIGAYFATATRANKKISFSSQVDIMPSPDNLNSISINSSAEKLSWQITDCADGYSLEFREQGSLKWKKKGNLDSSGNYTLENLKPSTIYVWRVASETWVNGIKAESNYSDSATFTTPASSLIADNVQATSISSTQLAALPNPAKNSFKILFSSSKYNKVNANLYDINGKAVWSSGLINANVLNNKTVITATFSKGIYYLKIINKSGSFIGSTKIVVAN